jgi:hypothetical protein
VYEKLPRLEEMIFVPAGAEKNIRNVVDWEFLLKEFSASALPLFRADLFGS